MTNPPSSSPGSNPSSAAAVFVAYLFVGIPLAWGVMQTLIKSMALFH
jgi:hypothetical protein